MSAIAEMQIGSQQWIDIILEGAARMGLAVSDLQAAQFARHGQLLMEWNRKINLTSITDPMQVAVKHFLDAIAPLKHIPADGRLLDIGTGGGFPGIPLKVMRPRQTMTLIDSVRKKINFVKHVLRQLGLDRIEALQTRAEALKGHGIQAEKFEVIVSRALADLNTVAQTAIPLIADEGCIVAYHGPRDERHYSGRQFSTVIKDRPVRCRLWTVTYQLPFLGDNRTVSILKIAEPISQID